MGFKQEKQGVLVLVQEIMFNYQTLFEIVKILVELCQKSPNIQRNRLGQQKSLVGGSLKNLDFLLLTPAYARKEYVFVQVEELIVGTVAERPEKIMDYQFTVRKLFDLIHLYAVVPLQEEIAFFYLRVLQKCVIYVALVSNNQSLSFFPSVLQVQPIKIEVVKGNAKTQQVGVQFKYL